MDTNIHTRALLVWLSIGTWSARKYDKTVTNKVNATYNATSDAGRYNKCLLPGDCPAYKTLTTLAGAIRSKHYANTLAWSDEGWRLLPVANYDDYTTWLRSQRTEFENALRAFVQDYPSMKAQAARLLNGMYRAEDYPDATDIEKRFTVSVQFNPVPAEGDIRVNLAKEQVEAIEASIAERVHSSVKVAMADAWKRLYDVVEHMNERLGDPEAIFRDTLVTNAQEVCAALRKLNIEDDPNLEAMRARVEAELTRYSPDMLRDEPVIRKRTADRAADIMRQMAGLYDASAA